MHLCVCIYIYDQVYEFDPCSDNYVNTYLNLEEVQAALHVKPTQWSACGYASTKLIENVI